ncbi:RusA family crossover junction endodeoxyribonuclease [Clostridium sp. BJN0001]|uniref:RusA family crossover junction endodeoxyribonuclease n=1 Tax=Clostridium sp. BJN0001 TaxID=2930219 RepID=UPI001FD3341E|nr:RusA family crossover junction endodeoxyribonuclease [Clostridium sp. BJN0001]
MCTYAKIIVDGSPLTKSNFKLHNKNGRAILPTSSGSSNDRYAVYEEKIAYMARAQNPNIILDESLIAILHVYYKSEKRHPDTINITKSIFDGIEKSGLIVNDAQITKIYTEEHFDKINPRFELFLYPESKFNISIDITNKKIKASPKIYFPNTKNILHKINKKAKETEPIIIDSNTCSVCGKKIQNDDYVSTDKGKKKICRKCFSKLF